MLEYISFGKKTSNDIITTGLVDEIYSSEIVVAINPKMFPIVSLGRKLSNGP